MTEYDKLFRGGELPDSTEHRLVVRFTTSEDAHRFFVHVRENGSVLLDEAGVGVDDAPAQSVPARVEEVEFADMTAAGHLSRARVWAARAEEWASSASLNTEFERYDAPEMVRMHIALAAEIDRQAQTPAIDQVNKMSARASELMAQMFPQTQPPESLHALPAPAQDEVAGEFTEHVATLDRLIADSGRASIDVPLSPQATPCAKESLFVNGEYLPTCQRPATRRLEVQATVGTSKGGVATVDVCDTCAGLIDRTRGLKVVRNTSDK